MSLVDKIRGSKSFKIARNMAKTSLIALPLAVSPYCGSGSSSGSNPCEPAIECRSTSDCIDGQRDWFCYDTDGCTADTYTEIRPCETPDPCRNGECDIYLDRERSLSLIQGNGDLDKNGINDWIDVTNNMSQCCVTTIGDPLCRGPPIDPNAIREGVNISINELSSMNFYGTADRIDQNYGFATPPFMNLFRNCPDAKVDPIINIIKLYQLLII